MVRVAESTRPGCAEMGLVSRRDAIMGALALAAGTLMATRPEEAKAANGDSVVAGSITIGASPTYVWRTATGYLGPVYSQAALNWDNGAGAHHAVDGEVYALAGAAGAGIRGTAASVGQFGVLAEHKAAAGTALRVNGVASFSRSGRKTILKGRSGATVTGLTNIGTGSLILVTLQGSAGTGNYVRYAQRVSDTSFKVALTKPASSTVSFAWLILN